MKIGIKIIKMVRGFRWADEWIPPCQARGRLSQGRNDNQGKGAFDALLGCEGLGGR